MEYIEGPAVVLYFRSSQVEGQHHFVFRDGQVQRLFDSLRFCSEPAQDIDHLVGVTGIAAEAVPFGEQDQIADVPFLFQGQQQAFPFRPVESFGGMVFKNGLTNLDVMDTAVFAQHFFLVALAVPFVCLFIRTHTDI
ncbi:MAG TPA: hypothetical protein VK563_06645 [Puia sp.]|nr:hypothetical protein [Puia sp.]